MKIAVTRKVSRRFDECEITHIDRVPIDVEVARNQHQGYVDALARLGCRVIDLPEEPDLPDSVFVEDAAFVLPEAVVITRPGADSRKPETESIALALSPFLPIVYIREPATLDGGDVLVMGKDVYIGLSTRSNTTAISQIEYLIGMFGYRVIGVEMHDCLHLKSAATRINDTTLLINRKWVNETNFRKYDWVEVDDSEPSAANCLPVNGEIIYPDSFPRTRDRLESLGHIIRPVVVSELAKAEGAVTCCSLLIDALQTTGAD